MTCFGLPPAPCSSLFVIFQKLEGPLSLVGRLGMTGSMIALALLLLRALGTPLVHALQAMVPRSRHPSSDEMLRF